MYKQFIIVKNEYKKSDRQPSDRMLVNIDGDWHEVAGLWEKSKDGKRFFSGKMREPYQDRDGYVIITQKEYEQLQKQKSNKEYDDFPAYGDTDDVDPDKIPF